MLLILGDGARDEQVVRYVAPRFDGSRCSVASPRLPLFIPVKRGLSALEAVVEISGMGFEVRQVFFLVDEEHIPSPKALREWLKEHGFEVVEEALLSQEAFFFVTKRGPRTINIYVAIARRSLEEESAKLIKDVLGEKATFSRKNLKRALEMASVEQLSRAYVGLATVLKALEQACREIPK